MSKTIFIFVTVIIFYFYDEFFKVMSIEAAQKRVWHLVAGREKCCIIWCLLGTVVALVENTAIAFKHGSV
jgi:hypothetical protein